MFSCFPFSIIKLVDIQVVILLILVGDELSMNISCRNMQCSKHMKRNNTSRGFLLKLNQTSDKSIHRLLRYSIRYNFHVYLNMILFKIIQVKGNKTNHAIGFELFKNNVKHSKWNTLFRKRLQYHRLTLLGTASQPEFISSRALPLPGIILFYRLF